MAVGALAVLDGCGSSSDDVGGCGGAGGSGGAAGAGGNDGAGGSGGAGGGTYPPTSDVRFRFRLTDN